jgi:hypothetical protein
MPTPIQYGPNVRYGVAGFLPGLSGVGRLQSFSINRSAPIDDSVEDEDGTSVTHIVSVDASSDIEFSAEFVIFAQAIEPTLGASIEVTRGSETYRGAITAINESYGNRDKGKYSITARRKGATDYTVSSGGA